MQQTIIFSYNTIGYNFTILSVKDIPNNRNIRVQGIGVFLIKLNLLTKYLRLFFLYGFYTFFNNYFIIYNFEWIQVEFHTEVCNFKACTFGMRLIYVIFSVCFYFNCLYLGKQARYVLVVFVIRPFFSYVNLKMLL